MNFDNSIRNILTDSKVLEAKISNFRSNILQKDDLKLSEVSKLIKELDNRGMVKSDHLVDLLQYHSLVEELTVANG